MAGRFEVELTDSQVFARLVAKLFFTAKLPDHFFRQYVYIY
jgi:hypothetical protein